MKKNCISISTGLRKTLMVLLALMLLTMTWFSFIPGTTTAANEHLYGGTLRVAISDEPSEKFNPLTTHQTGDLDILDLMYDSLAIRDVETGKMIPWLAESWTTDENSVTVTLRENIEFWDGSIMTADDVKYSYDNYEGPLMVPVTGVTVDDSLTITFDLSQNNPAFFITDGMRVPIVKEGTDDMGSGPFMDLTKNVEEGIEVTNEFLRASQDDAVTNTVLNLVFDNVYDVELYAVGVDEHGNKTDRELIDSSDYNLNEQMGRITNINIPADTEISVDYKYDATTYDLVANENYFMDRPYLDGISFQVFQKIAAPKGLNIDGIPLGPGGSAATHMAGAVNQLGNNNIDYIKPYFPGIHIRFINMAHASVVEVPVNEFVYAAYNAESAPFNVGENDITVERAEAAKRAINLLFGRGTVVDNMLSGAGYRGVTVVSPANEYWFNPDTNAVRQNFKEANDIMDAAGFADFNADGFRNLPNEEHFSLKVTYPSILEDENPGSIGGGLAGDGGLGSIRINSIDDSTTISNVRAAELSGDFDISIGRHDAAIDPGMDIYALFHSDSPHNFINLNDPVLDAAIEEVNSILDQDERQEAMNEIQEILLQKMPISVIYSPTLSQVYRNDFYTGWMNGFHVGVHNKQNYLSVHRMTDDSITLSITMMSSLTGGTDTTITVLAEDRIGNPIADAEVELYVSMGQAVPRTERTDAGGTIIYDYTVPEVSGLTDIIVSADVVKGTNIGTGSFVATIHPEISTFNLRIEIDKTQMESGESAEITVQVLGMLDTYPEITLTLLPSTGSAWLDKTNNAGETGPEFTTTLHTDGVLTETTFRIRAIALDQTQEGTIRVNAQDVDASESTPMWLYMGMGLAVIIILIILIMAMIGGKKGAGAAVAEPKEDTYDEFEEPEVEEEDIFEEEEDIFEEEEDIFEEPEVEEEELFEEPVAEEPELSPEQQAKLDKLEKAHADGKMPTEIYEKNKKKILEG